MRQYLAIDIGASSGRHIAGRIEGGRLVTEEVYRFRNGNKEQNGHLVWDIEELLAHVRQGIAAAIAKCGQFESLSVDTWGVDYVLMEGDKEILPCYAYRDARGAEAAEGVHARIPFAQLYARTGIQFQPFNTIYQLYADLVAGRLDRATDFLMLPQYILYKLTGVKACEYTDATTTGLLGASSRAFDGEIVSALGLPSRLFSAPVLQPGTCIGSLKPEAAAEVGGTMRAVVCASHDTASAVLAAPVEEGEPYLSSGTWSLLGVEQRVAHTDGASLANNFSNEGGAEGTFRYQKNIMGLWMLQSARRELDLDFAQAEALARANPCDALVDCEDAAFLAPASMCAAVREKAGQLTDGQLLHCIYNSLAHCYKRALDELGTASGTRAEALRVIGGGSQDAYLNELTASVAGVTVEAGPKEATAIGNLLMQMVAAGEIASVREGRKLVQNSFEMKTYPAGGNKE